MWSEQVPPSPRTPLPRRGRGASHASTKHMIRQAASRDTRKAIVGAARDLRQRQTASEGLLWEELRNRKLAGRKFRRQSRVGHNVVDFYCAAEHLVIEVDGGIHETQRSDDRHRQRVIEAAGLRVLRISADACEQDIENVLRRIRETFRSQTNALPSPSSRVRGRG